MARGGNNGRSQAIFYLTAHEERMERLRVALGQDMTPEQQLALLDVRDAFAEILDDVNALRRAVVKVQPSQYTHLVNPAPGYTESTLERIAKRRHIPSKPRDGMSTPCWEDTGLTNDSGYGIIGYVWLTPEGEARKSALSTHRVMYLLTHGKLRRGHVILHACDNTLCHNPQHLTEGTHTDNMRDMVAKGRGRNMFTPEQEATIIHDLTSGDSAPTICERYNMTMGQLNHQRGRWIKDGKLERKNFSEHKNFSREQIEDMVHMREGGSTLKQIGEYYDCSEATVRKYIKLSSQNT